MLCATSRCSNVVPLPDTKTANFIGLILASLFIIATPAAQARNLKFVNEMNEALKINNLSQTHTEWHKSAQILKQAKESMFSRIFTDIERCAYLKSLDDEDLLSFYEEVHEPLSSNRISPCVFQLSGRISTFIENGVKRLQNTAKDTNNKLIRKCSDRKSTTFGPETDYFIDPTNGGRLFGEFLPNCTVSFTFDDGPHKNLTPKLLEILEDEDVLVNFFVVGQRVKSSPDILKNAHAAGHLIGNHSMTHADLRKLTYKSATAEIDNTFDLITSTLSLYLPFFRFPYGASTKDLRAYLSHFSRVEFFWNVDTLDWKIKDPEELYKYTLSQIDKVQRGIVLMHDVQPQSIAALPYIFESLRDAGYSPVLIRPTPTSDQKNRKHVH